jgi:hypothetical protein
MAGIDVHKKRLAVVVADVEVEDEYQVLATLLRQQSRTVARVVGMAHRAQPF